ncbi:pyrroline-5-carboxylate reductase [Chitinimonas sp. PSY-7]|uniref:pyrroline-5-carboxylate reductase n=1 Tax=Chitinimonas sp. PSY-7 TaxID=3459088 RepID=UPI004040226F
MNILFIGGGNMATAMVGGLLQQGFIAGDICIVDPSEEARQKLVSSFGVHTFAADAALPMSDVVVLATKPQQLAAVAQQRAAELAGRLVISIAAGIRMADLDRWLNRAARLIRVMPNTPALVRAGICGAWLGPHATQADRVSADRILASTGAVVWVADEARLDAITAISGSGPAYVFYFMESLTEAAIQLGFDAVTARQLAYATFDGAIKLAQASPDSAGALREKVTSKGGTTEAALKLMGEKGIQAAIVLAAQAAENRAAELADELGCA